MQRFDSQGFKLSATEPIFLEPAWKLPSAYGSLVNSPPQGYRFVQDAGRGILIHPLASSRLVTQAHDALVSVLPLQALLSLTRSFRRKIGTLTYSSTHIIARDEPWVLDMANELPYLLTSTEAHFRKLRGVVRRRLLSPNCRGIVCWCEAGRQAMIQELGPEIAEKTCTVYWGAAKRRFEEPASKNKVRILFVNSSNIVRPDHFFDKGGLEVLFAFKEILRRHSKVELVLRSSVPPAVAEFCSKIPQIKLLKDTVSWDALEREWRSSDIFIVPNHCNTPAAVFLEAMSYGLPIVTTDIWANSEFIRDGENGILVEYPESKSYMDGVKMHLNSREYRATTTKVSTRLVKGLADALDFLVKHDEVRDAMGRFGRQLVENGMFSLESRNARLKMLLDKATGAA